jgi:hypothetical protein
LRLAPANRRCCSVRSSGPAGWCARRPASGRCGCRNVGRVLDLELGLDRSSARDQGRHPVFVGDAEPAALRVALLERLLLPGLVLELFGRIALAAVGAEGADGALVQDLGLAQRWRHALALDAAIGGDGHGLGSQVGDGVLDREHILVVDRDDADEPQALAVVPGQGDRGRGRQGRTVGQRPDRVRAGHAAGHWPVQPNWAK